MSEKEFNDKWSGKDPDMMEDEQLLQFKNDCYDLYEETGFLPVFDSPYDEGGEHNGMPFTVLRRATPEEVDIEAMPIWKVRFANGDEAFCYPEEITILEKERKRKPSRKTETNTKAGSMYLTVRIDYEYPGDADEEEIRQELMSECDYSFSSRDGQPFRITNTEICGQNTEF